MFELANERPPHWPSLEIPSDEFTCSQVIKNILYPLVLHGLLCSVGVLSMCMKKQEISIGKLNR